MNYGGGIGYTLVAGTALAQYVGVKADGNICASGIDFHGVQQDKPVAGDHIKSVTFGETKVLCGSGGLAVADKVSITTSGYFCKVTSGGYFIGRCISAAASGGIANAMVHPPSYFNGA